MYSKNLILILFVFLIIGCDKKKQLNPANYINLVYYKDKSDNNILSHIYTEIKDRNDSVGMFIKKHKPRFNYFISNKIKVDSLEKLYPDTSAIKKIFLKQISEQQFVSNFYKLTKSKKQEYQIYSMDEILKVASRFFVIVDVGNSFGIKICAGGNDFEDLNAIKDVTLIESIAYEAIISVFQMKKNEQPEFISNTRTYFSNINRNLDSISNDELLSVAKNKLYSKMEKDKSLELFLNKYLLENSNNLPFKIK